MIKQHSSTYHHAATRLLLFCVSAFLLLACSSKSGYFKIEGRFLHINQGELYVYSPDGGIKGIDTIKIQAGRFAYETPMKQDAILMLVFPNFSEHPVFASPGGSVDIKADASHLKEMTVEGTKENKLMNTFRKMIVSASPPEEKNFAAQFIKDHPESLVATYLIRKYFIQSTEPDYKKALALAETIQKAQPDNGTMVQLRQSLKTLMKSQKNNTIPTFRATTTDNRTVTSADLSKGIAVINVWSTWNYESQEAQRIIRDMKKRHDTPLHALGISIDANKKECIRWMENNYIEWENVCDGMMLESPLMKQLGLSRIPETLVIKDGSIVERDLSNNELRRKLDDMLKQE